MSINITPIGERIVVEPIAAEEKTLSGLFIPEIAREKPNMGIAVSVHESFAGVKLGDTILYNKHAGVEVTIDGKNYLVLNKQEALCAI